MKTQVLAGVRDAWRIRGRTVTFAAMVAIGTFLVSTGLSELGSSIADLASARDLAQRDATYFRVHYLTDEPFEASGDLSAFLSEAMGGGGGFTTVRYNHGVRESFPYPVLFVMGDFETAFGLPEIPVGSAAIGADVSLYSIGDVVDLGVTTVRVDAEIPPQGAFFDPWQSRESLATTVVVKLDAADLAALGWTGKEEAVARAVLLGASDAAVDRYVELAWRSGLQLIPATVADAGADVTLHQRDSLLYTAGYGAFVLLVVVGAGSSAAATARRARRSLAIQRLHGARVVDVALRLSTYLALTVLLPALGSFALAAIALPGVLHALPWAVAAVATVFAALVARVVSVVTRTDLATQLGGLDT